MPSPTFLKSLFTKTSKKPTKPLVSLNGQPMAQQSQPMAQQSQPMAQQRKEIKPPTGKTFGTICIKFKSFENIYMTKPPNIQSPYHLYPFSVPIKPEVSEFTATEKVMIREAVRDTIEDSTLMKYFSELRMPIKPSEKIWKGNNVEFSGQTFTEDTNIGFYKHMARLKWFFGSNSTDLRMDVQYGLRQIHSVLTNNTELMIFTDIRGADIPPFYTPPNTTGYNIYVGKHFLGPRTNRQHRTQVIYTDMLNQVLDTCVQFSSETDDYIRNRACHNDVAYYGSGSKDNITPKRALLNTNSWVDFIDSCCQLSQAKTWHQLELKTLGQENITSETAVDPVFYHTRHSPLAKEHSERTASLLQKLLRWCSPTDSIYKRND